MIEAGTMSEPMNPEPDYDLGEGLRKTFPIAYAESGADKKGLEKFPIFYVDGKPQTQSKLSAAITIGIVCGLLVALVVIFQ